MDPEYFDGHDAAVHAMGQHISTLEARLAAAEALIDLCYSFTGSLWPQNETTREMAAAIDKARADNQGGLTGPDSTGGVG
jgi:hypothetical protein